MTSPAERQRLALAVLGGRPVTEVAAEAGLEAELVRRWAELFVEGGTLRLAGRLDPSSFEARDRFLVLVAHEFRTPLAIIRGWVETLLGTDPRDGGQEGSRPQPPELPADIRRDALGVILRQVDNLERIARDALDAGAVAQGELRLVVGTFDLRALLRSVTDAMPDSPIVVEDGPEVLVVADSARMEQVVADVYAHAARLSLGDTITVAVDAVMPDPDQRSGGDAGRGGGSGGQVTVTVTVIGRPLTFEEASELFEPYGRSDTSTGTGLGLFLCRALLAAHGGEIGLRSSGSTSEFWFRLPCSGPPSGPLVERL